MADDEKFVHELEEVPLVPSQSDLPDVETQPQNLTVSDVEPPPQNLPLPEDNPLQRDLKTPVDEPSIDITQSPNATTDTSMKEQTEINEHELLEGQFNNYLRIAKALMRTLKRPKDIEVCSDLLRRVQKLNGSRHLEVKRNNNRFFRYCLRVIKYTSDNQPLEYYRRMFNDYGDDISDDKSNENRTWFEENKSYVASKTLKDGTLIVYMALAKEPKAGWQEGGLAILEKKGACAV